MTNKLFNRTIVAAAASAILLQAFTPMAVFAASSVITPAVNTTNSVQSWTSVQEVDGATTLAIRFTKAFDGNMSNFKGPAGDYVAFDFPGYGVGESARNIGIAQGAVKGVRFVETGKRLRAIVQIEKGVDYKTFIQDGVLIVRFANAAGAPVTGNTVNIPAVPAPVSLPDRGIAPTVSIPTDTRVKPASTTTAGAHAANLTAGPSIANPAAPTSKFLNSAVAALRDIEYKKIGTSNGRLLLDLSDPGIKVKVYRDASSLVIELPNTSLPRNLAKRMLVENMETPILAITPTIPKDGSTKLILEARGGWDYTFTQNNTNITVDVVKTGDDYKIGGKKVFNGKKISLSFQQIDVRTVLQILAEFTGLNIIASDSVKGDITLRLNEVPWDQALDIILASRGLDLRRNGQVLWIAPKSEISVKEQQEFTDKKAMEGLEPMVTETFQLNYQKAEEMKKIMPASKSGSVLIDTRTNQMFVKDTFDNLDEIRRMIKQVDVPVRQVTIEAKIVEVSDSFAKNVGVKFGLDGAQLGFNGAGLMLGSSLGNNTSTINGSPTSSTNPSLNVNMPANGIAGANVGTFAFTLFNSSLTKFLNLEVSALEADGKAKTISSPRVVTSDGKEATIEQGTDIPYQAATSSGATSVSFKKATMALKVTPQITPDGRVTLDIGVNKDSVGQITTAGPAIDTKQVKTTVLVDNGGTIVIGGIFIIDETNVENKVPVLGDIPYLGAAFRNSGKTTTKKEMVIMITPRVIE